MNSGSTDEGSYLSDCQTILVIALHALSLPIFLAFHKHNSLSLGQKRAFLSSTKELHANKLYGMLSMATLDTF